MNKNIKMEKDAKMIDMSTFINMLRTDVVEFQFEKKDGSIRTAYGTRNPKIIADKIGATTSSTIKGKSSDKPGLITYFDMEKVQFRCFAEERFLGVIDEHSRMFESNSSANNILNFEMYTYINESLNSCDYEEDEEE